MNRNSILAFLAGGLLIVAAILSFARNAQATASIGLIGGISFILAGIHWGRKARNQNRP